MASCVQQHDLYHNFKFLIYTIVIGDISLTSHAGWRIVWVAKAGRAASSAV